MELEFESREAASRRAILSEIDARLRNERLTLDTTLDLVKEETALELELEMESRLSEFRLAKETEVAEQLERQLSKREEIMRNKALIEVRKREATIRAEIEAQLGLKRAEIRDRLTSLTEQMDQFKEMAEVKMREAIEGQIQGEIDTDQAKLVEAEQELARLGSEDVRVAKRQSWLQAISGDARRPPAAWHPVRIRPRSEPVPTHLPRRGGRAMRGLLGERGPDEAPRLGLAGMAPPQVARRSLSEIEADLLPRPVKAPITPSDVLPAPVAPRIKTPLPPVADGETEPAQVLTPAANLDEPALDPVQRAPIC